MLWETTVRFHLISVPAASAILIVFAFLGLAIAWKRSITSIAWIVTLTALGSAMALFRESHDAASWVGTILLVAIAVEFSACRDHWLTLRWVVAVAADLTVLLLTIMTTMEPSSASSVAPAGAALVLGAQIALLTIYLSSTGDRTIVRRLPITRFEIGQAAVAFLISTLGALRLAGIDRAAAAGVGWFCISGAAACYLVSFSFFDRREGGNRNFVTYSTFALLLAIAGCWVLFDGTTLAGTWALLAVVSIAAAFLRDRDTLRFHSAAYLLLAVVSSQLAPQAMGRIIGNTARAGISPSTGYLLVLLSAALCYSVIVRLGQRAEPHWVDRVEATIAAALTCLGLAGLGASVLYDYVSPAAPLRTALVTAIALGAAWAGRRWRRPEFTWLAYPLMALSGFKLLTEDYQQGRSLTLFASLILFGGGLIVLPRLLRHKNSPRPSHAAG
jgi:hypothetical protein